MRRKGDHVCVADWRGIGARRDEPRYMGDIGEQNGARRVGDGPKFGPIYRPRIGGIAGDDKLRSVLPGKFLHGLII